MAFFVNFNGQVTQRQKLFWLAESECILVTKMTCDDNFDYDYKVTTRSAEKARG